MLALFNSEVFCLLSVLSSPPALVVAVLAVAVLVALAPACAGTLPVPLFLRSGTDSLIITRKEVLHSRKNFRQAFLHT